MIKRIDGFSVTGQGKGDFLDLYKDLGNKKLDNQCAIIIHAFHAAHFVLG
jgi:hypothetical protein